MGTYPALSSLRESLITAISLMVFSFLDLMDFLLCLVYRSVDRILEGNPSHCYCQRRGEDGKGTDDEGEGISETLYGRRNIFREMLGHARFAERINAEGKQSTGGLRAHRWSDCGCERCSSWQSNEEEMLHLVVNEPVQETSQDHGKGSTESVIFLHGFISSSSFWVETVFPNLSESTTNKLRMIAVDLLGFGRSPKPTNCLYKLEEHLEQIDKSVFKPFRLSSFHLVAHSMGCVLAVSLAAKYPTSAKSITLIAPPYFPQSDRKAPCTALNRLAQRKVWPPLLFGSSVMSWYEHLGRTVCFIVCRNHLKWEWIIRLLTRRRDLHFIIKDLSMHTHHSAWHTMHNVICGGANLLDQYLEVLKREKTPVKLIHGGKDQVVPLECIRNIKSKVPGAELQIIDYADHITVVIGREKSLAKELENLWFSTGKCSVPKDISATCLRNINAID